VAGGRKEFGRRGVNPPPVVVHAAQGLPGGPEPHSARRLRTLAVTIGAIGATTIGLVATVEAFDRARRCPQPENANPDAPPCQSAASGGHGGSSGGGRSFWSSGSSRESGHSGASYGGFGGEGGAHGGHGGGE